MVLKATVEGHKLTLSGAAAVSSTYPGVTLTSSGGTRDVKDNDAIGTKVSVSGEGYDVRSVDIRGLTGAGAYVYLGGTGSLAIRGSHQDDHLTAASNMGQASSIYGYDGNDYLTGYMGNDKLFGGSGSDNLSGGRGDDTLSGGRGADTFNGGDGIDTIVLVGNRSEYDITTDAGHYVISHIGGTKADGIDSFANIEQLQFADQLVKINSTPTNLVATVEGHKLTLSGAAAVSSTYPGVTLTSSGGTRDVKDNDAIGTKVSVSGEGYDVRSVDIRGLTGAGAYVYLGGTGSLAIRGSHQDDHLTAASNMGQASSIYGYDGNDYLTGYMGNDKLFGGSGSDNLSGGRGDDTLSGGRGADTFNGGDGIDTIVLVGNRSEYDITTDAGHYVISHIGGTKADGIDSFANIEQLQFADQLVKINSTPTNLVATVEGHKLTLSGAAAVSSTYPGVTLTSSGGTRDVKDNDAIGTKVSVSGEGYDVRSVDIRGLTGAGAYVYLGGTGSLAIRGSHQDDHLTAASNMGQASSIYGYDGNDYLTGYMGNDKLFGGSGSDNLSGGRGDDTLSGGRGADTFNGGDGIDTIVLVGNRSEYEITTDAGHYVISHIGGTRADGIDSFANIERLQFADQLVNFSDLIV